MRTQIERVDIPLGDRSYDILIGSGLLAQSASFEGLQRASSAVIVTNPTVARLYATQLQTALKTHYPKVLQIELQDGEAFRCFAKAAFFQLGGKDFEHLLDEFLLVALD